jgi:hypothetical protein
LRRNILRWNKESEEVEEFTEETVPTESSVFLGAKGWATGLESAAAGCHSSQVDEFRKDARDAGISGVDFRPDGSAVFSCRSARKEYMRHRGLYDRDAGYGDALPSNF